MLFTSNTPHTIQTHPEWTVQKLLEQLSLNIHYKSFFPRTTKKNCGKPTTRAPRALESKKQSEQSIGKSPLNTIQIAPMEEVNGQICRSNIVEASSSQVRILLSVHIISRKIFDFD